MGAAAPRYAMGVIAVAATIWILVQARPVLEPLVLSALLWFLLTALARVFARAAGASADSPPLWTHLASALVALLLILGLSLMVASSLAGFRENLPAYEQNLIAMVEGAVQALGLGENVDLAALAEGVQVSDVVISLAGSAVGFASTLIVVIVYVLFIYAESKAVPGKFAALAGDQDRLAALTGTVAQIRRDIETYLGVKCVIGLVQAVPTYLILMAAGLDGAAFWAVIIFVASFVPTVGSLVGIAFPAVVALAQFGSLPIFLGLTAMLAVVQLAGSNWLEPKLMGSSLNLSPLVILIAIFSGGALWGITGALVAVPALSIAVIVFTRIDSMRPVAVLLSSDGNV